MDPSTSETDLDVGSGASTGRRDAVVPGEPSGSVRERLLEAALVEFAIHGYASGSLRRLTQRAGVALGNVRHVFGSKHALLAALLQSIWDPCTEQRLDALDALEARPEPPTVVELFDTSAAPVVEILTSERGVYVGMFLAHGAVEHDAFWPVAEKSFAKIGDRFPAAYARLNPDLPKDEAYHRWAKTMQAFFHWMTPTLQHVENPQPFSEAEIARLRGYALQMLAVPGLDPAELPPAPWTGRLGG